MTWWTDYQARRGQDRKTLYLDNMKNLVSTEFENSTSYNLVKINNIERKVRIVEESIITKNPNKKRLICKPNETIIVGDIIDFNGSKWICTDNDITSEIYDIGIITRCNNTLKFYPSSTTIPNENSLLIEVPCIVGDKVNIKIDELKYLTTVSNELYLTLANTEITRQIKVNDVYRLGLHSYRIESLPDDVYIPSLLVFRLSYSEVEQIFPVFSVVILNGESLSTDITTPIQLNVQTLKDNVALSSTLPLTYSSSNALVATISSSGLVTPLTTGNVIISCKLTNDLLVSDSIVIDVVALPQNNYTVEISGSTSITKGYSSAYICVFKNNGITITDSSVFYLTADNGVSSTTLAQIISQDSVANSCIVKGLELGYVKLWVKNVGETVVSNGFRIQIKNIF